MELEIVRRNQLLINTDMKIRDIIGEKKSKGWSYPEPIDYDELSSSGNVVPEKSEEESEDAKRLAEIPTVQASSGLLKKNNP